MRADLKLSLPNNSDSYYYFYPTIFSAIDKSLEISFSFYSHKKGIVADIRIFTL